MRDACLIEQTSSGVACEHYATVLDRIFARDDIVLVAAGGLSCLRPLYFKALSLGKLEQCMFCMMSLGDYATGGAEKVLADTVRNAASRPCTRCVIIYVSCAEILSQCDFDAIERQGASRGVTIRALYRGPLTARRGNVLEQLDDTLEKIPEGDSPRIAEEAFQLPPLPPDFSGIASLLQGWDAYPVLLTAGGCSSSVSISDVFNGTIRLDHSRFNDIEIARGCEQPAIAGISRAYQLQNHRLCCLLGSPVMEMTGLDFTGTQAELEALGIPTLHCPSDGFEPAQVGISSSSARIAKGYFPMIEEHRFVNVWAALHSDLFERYMDNGTEILKSWEASPSMGRDSLERIVAGRHFNGGSG